MSTKTTLKRIALVAVSALGFGLLSVIPAKAAAIDSSSADVVAAPATATIATTAKTTTRITLVDGATTDTLSFRLLQSGTDAATAFTWKVLEHSSNLVINDYSGDSTETFAVTYPTTAPTAGSPSYIWVQIGTAAATAANTVALQASHATPASWTSKFTATVVAAGVAPAAPIGVDSTDTPFRVVAGQTNVTAASEANLASITAASTVTAATDVFKVIANNDTVLKTGTGSYRYVEVTGSTIAAVAGAMVVDGTVNSATRAFAQLDGNLESTADAQVWVNAATAGTVTIKFIDRSIIASTTPFLGTGTQYVDTVLQTITLTVTAPTALSAQMSTSFINAVHSSTTGVATSKPTLGLWGDCDAVTAGTQNCDYTILAPAALAGVGGVVSGAGTAKAVIQVNLKDAAGAALVGTLPAVGASVSGPGTLSIGTSANADASTGRSLSATAAPASTFYINVFSDGTSGASTVSILVGGSVWTTKSLKFYTTPTTVSATQGLKVLKANTVSGCVGIACDDSDVANTVAVKVVATDANGIPVPFRSYSVTSSDATVLLGAATAAQGNSAVADYLGANWYTVASTFGAASGASATLTYTTALTSTTNLSSSALKFAIGGAPASASLAISTGANVGDKGTMTISVKDASGNAIYDSDHTLALTSSTALTTALGQIAATGNQIAVIDGKSTIDFFNPLVSGTVSVTGLVSGLLPVSGSFTVSNSAIDAAVDAAAEAIDAANAATDAANLAAEAADAATVAAEEARDAADAATAAIEELATQVATLMAALKAQITTLANTVAKIAKKVKA